MLVFPSNMVFCYGIQHWIFFFKGLTKHRQETKLDRNILAFSFQSYSSDLRLLIVYYFVHQGKCHWLKGPGGLIDLSFKLCKKKE